MWYVYFLKLANDDIYVGSTNDVRRLDVSFIQSSGEGAAFAEKSDRLAKSCPRPTHRRDQCQSCG